MITVFLNQCVVIDDFKNLLKSIMKGIRKFKKASGTHYKQMVLSERYTKYDGFLKKGLRIIIQTVVSRCHFISQKAC